MKAELKSKKLNRYTTLPVLLDMLKRSKIVLLEPSHWEDKNDTELIEEYKERRNISKLFAICFCRGNETIHAWKAFASGISGCCIQFDRDRLLASLNHAEAVSCQDVDYCTQKEVDEGDIGVMPFIKRWPYRIEREFRIVWEGNSTEDKISIDIDLNSIDRITVSQEMPTSVMRLIKDLLRDCTPPVRVNRSKIFRNPRFIASVKNATST